MYSVCVIGHVTKDVVRLDDRPPRELPGGSAYYTGIALQRLGLEVAAITKTARSDARSLLRKLRDVGVRVYFCDSKETTLFENIYSSGNLEFRNQEVRSIAAPFDARDLARVRAKVFHLGPLTAADMSAAFLKAVCGRGGRVSLDAQGLVRRIERGKVRLADWPDKRRGLAHVDVLKADLSEARVLSGEHEPERAARALAELGPEEVIVTLGGRGSLILAGGRLYRIPAFAPRAVGDPTGCGDTYGAGYIFHRLQSDDIEAAGRFAAAAATLKLEHEGPFMGDASEVGARLKSLKTT